MEPVSGFYRAPVATLDFASLYPSIMMAHNLCYSTLLSRTSNSKQQEEQGDQLPLPDHVTAPASTFAATSKVVGNDVAITSRPPPRFVTSQVRRGLLPIILEELVAARKTTKKLMQACGPGA